MSRTQSKEKAQTLPILVIGILVIIMMGALLLDGGDLFLNRREAQAAADAGALAGAQQICLNTKLRKTNYSAYESKVIEAATRYAQIENLATSVIATLDSNVEGSDVIRVEVDVANDSFFAKILGENTLTAGAVAEAGCFPPEGNYVMPIAWSCRPPVGGAVFDPELGCKMQGLYWPGKLEDLLSGEISQMPIEGNIGNFEMQGDNIVNVDTGKPPKQIYIVMDKLGVNIETLCKEDFYVSDPGCTTAECKSAITCDLNGDGKNDIEGGGNRGWLDLNNGGGGASDLRNWIINGLDFMIERHTWLAGQTGTVTSVYDAMRVRVGDVVLIPVFNAICDDSSPLSNATCMNDAHADPWEDEPVSGDIDENAGQKPKFHVIEFAPFYISCVHIGKKDNCPGFNLAQEMNPDPKNPNKSLIPDNTPTVEGFFLEGYDFPLTTEEPCLVNLGNCLPSLTK
ncbi:MAG TPA: pilus assembly protein TadG-related protein [Anaerolineaceae bacterium]|nr:pilus assembly protein TadG-related protein [Anaerolineaceae bacterium]